MYLKAEYGIRKEVNRNNISDLIDFVLLKIAL